MRAASHGRLTLASDAAYAADGWISVTIRGVKQPLRVVCLGGGLGAPTVMAGLRAHTDDITRVIAGRDSGRANRQGRVAAHGPAPGGHPHAHPGPAAGGPGLPPPVIPP